MSVLSGAAVLAAASLILAACSGGGGNANAGASTGAAGGSTAGAAGTASTSGAGLPDPQPGAVPQGATMAMVAEGDSIFHGMTANGTCFTCHGADGKGTPLAPSLVDDQWATGDGTYDCITKRVTEAMPNPTPPYTSPMLPMGGVQLTPAQVNAGAAYVYSISNKS
jgi:mono/diheme cytochrome c family protein